MFGLFKRSKAKKEREYFEDEYSVHLILSKSGKHSIHDWEVWEECFNILDSKFKNSPHQINIQTRQSIQDSSKWLPFGRMIWSRKNNIKWTSKYKTGEDKKEGLQFFGTEFWGPSWTICYKERLSPDVFILIDSSNWNRKKKIFDQWLIIAQKKGKEILEKDLIYQLFDALHGETLIEGDRPWGYADTEISWTHALPDFSPHLLFNNMEDMEFSPKESALGKWKIIK